MIAKNITLLAGILIIGGAWAAGPGELNVERRVGATAAIDRGLAYLAAGQQADGGWEAFGQSHLGVTALVVKSLAQDANYGPKHAVTKRGVAFILRHVQPDGGIYAPGQGMKNYLTSVSLMALASIDSPAANKTIPRAQEFLKNLQWDSGEGHETSSSWFGGAGYGQHKRPDLSNTQMMLEALHESGLPADDPVYQKALVFISRCQLIDKTNDQPLADGTDDGGFVYTPANGGESKAGTTLLDGKPRLRSYGSMTYAGFKSMLYAKVDRDDERIRKAWSWIQRHYTLDHNPNMPGAQSKDGVFFFYHLFARTLAIWGEHEFTDADGHTHRWREELCDKLLSLQRDDGSWVNPADRWFEGNPRLVTAYVVLSLQTALKP